MIIDLTKERGKREAPDADFVRCDQFGRPVFSFLLDYELDGNTFSVTVWAADFDDAERHAKALTAGATVAGQIHQEIPG